jgi:integrase/recombinase XerC
MTAVAFDPLRDKSYQATRLGRDVADFLAWMELGGASPRTLDQYERDLARGALMWPDKGWPDITDGDAIQIAKTFRPAERRVRVAAWRSFERWAAQTRRIDRKPFDVLPRIKRPAQKAIDTFTDAEVELLCGLGDRDGPLMEIMFGAGPRKSDCRRLQVKHFRPTEDPDGRDTFVFLSGKGGKDRVVPVLPRVSRAVAQLILLDGLGDNDYLWYGVRANATSRRVTRSSEIGDGTFARWWGRCIAEAGVRYRHPHIARHTYATNWLRHGGRTETLQENLGHESSRTTTDLYVHLDMRDVLADLKVIEGRN